MYGLETKNRMAAYAHVGATGDEHPAPESVSSIFQACADGGRIVTVLMEAGAPDGSDGLGGPVLRKLVKRMLSGEFEAIVASFSKSDGGVEPDAPFMLRIEAHNDSMTQAGAL